MINEEIVTPRIVGMQTMEFDEWCNELADGSTVTPADVAAVMKRVEKRLPSFLCFNAKVVTSPDGLTFRPKVSGSISQSELKAKLQARKAAETDPEKAAKIDVNRALTTSDLSINDCTVSIVVELPKSWIETFKQKAKLKRMAKDSEELAESGDEGSAENTDNSDGSTTSGSNSGSGSESGSSSGSGAESGGSTTSGDTTGGGSDNGGGDGGELGGL